MYFLGNVADDCGGAIFRFQGSVAAQDCIFWCNSAQESEAVHCRYDYFAEIVGYVFYGNDNNHLAGNEGGAIYCYIESVSFLRTAPSKS